MTEMTRIMDKVTAFVVRDGPAEKELLILQHPFAGLQLPAGTMEPEETPDDAGIFAAWAKCLARQGHTDQARPILQRALSIASMHFEALRQLGELELAEGNFQAALPPLQAAASQRPYDTTTRNALGKTLQALGKADEARPHLEYAAAAEESLSRMERELRRVVERPTDPELRYDIGLTLLRYGSPPDGAKWLHTVLELDPSHQAAHRALAAYYESTGNLAQAARHGAQVRESESPKVEKSKRRKVEEAKRLMHRRRQRPA